MSFELCRYSQVSINVTIQTLETMKKMTLEWHDAGNPPKFYAQTIHYYLAVGHAAAITTTATAAAVRSAAVAVRVISAHVSGRKPLVPQGGAGP